MSPLHRLRQRTKGLDHAEEVFAIVLLVGTLTPPLWKKVERFDTGPDYRIPYDLSKDYWLYQRRLQRIASTNIIVLGDSVVWGEYVLTDGTLAPISGP